MATVPRLTGAAGRAEVAVAEYVNVPETTPPGVVTLTCATPDWNATGETAVMVVSLTST